MACACFLNSLHLSFFPCKMGVIRSKNTCPTLLCGLGTLMSVQRVVLRLGVSCCCGCLSDCKVPHTRVSVLRAFGISCSTLCSCHTKRPAVSPTYLFSHDSIFEHARPGAWSVPPHPGPPQLPFDLPSSRPGGLAQASRSLRCFPNLPAPPVPTTYAPVVP